MPDFENFRGLDHWALDTLEDFLQYRFSRESQSVEYKDYRWLFSEASTRLDASGKKKLRKYVTALANSGGGLLFVGIPPIADQQDLPGTPDGIPRSAWGQTNSQEVIRSSLANSVMPHLFPFPKISFVPLGDPPEAEVLIIDVFETVHAYHQVADGGGKVWVRLGDEVREMDQWLIRALSGQRGLHRPVPELVIQEDGGSFDMETRVVTQTFVLSNHGTGSLKEVQVGVVISKSEVEYPILKTPGYLQELSLPPKSLPAPLNPFYEIHDPIALVWNGDLLKPFEEVSFVAGCGGIILPLVQLGIWITGEGIMPIVKAYKMGRDLGTRYREMEGPPYAWAKDRS